MTEDYSVTIDGSVRSQEQLFTRFTETIFLGHFAIPGWDQFEDLLFLRWAESNIIVDVKKVDLTGLQTPIARLPRRDCTDRSACAREATAALSESRFPP